MASELADKIAATLKSAGSKGLMAKDIAKSLGVTKKDVNSILYSELRTEAKQDKSYKWRLNNADKKEAPITQYKPKQKTQLKDICEYYLSCIGDDGVELSTFASSNYGDPDYVELSDLPSAEYDAFKESSVANLIGKAKRDRNKKSIYFGFPCVLRHAKSKKSSWEGYFLEPLFLYQLDYLNPDGAVRIDYAFPLINQNCLKHMSNSAGAEIINEVLALEDELGLLGEDDAPDYDDLFLRLNQIKPEWPWVEECNPDALITDPPLSKMVENGIYNRAVVVMGSERPPFTQGLESELKKLASKSESDYSITVLGKWLQAEGSSATRDLNEPLIEVLPMNSEQRTAVERAMVEDLTVITGPPGTGKSQVVTNLLINAAWQKKRVLFASKNNKAVDVVDARVNNLGSRPVVLRLGSGEYQNRLAEYLLAVLSTTGDQSDQVEFDEIFEIHQQLSKKHSSLVDESDAVVQLRNETDNLEKQFDVNRENFDQDLITKALSEDSDYDGVPMEKIVEGVIDVLGSAVKSNQTFFTRLFWIFNKGDRQKAAADNLNAKELFLSSIHAGKIPDVESDDSLQSFLKELANRQEQIHLLLRYSERYVLLKSKRKLEEIQRELKGLQQQISGNSESLWKAWINIQPLKMSATDRQELSKYNSLLKMVVDTPSTQMLDRSTYSAYQKLLNNVSHLLTVWAVTSLSVKGKIPLKPCEFDLVVFDEASQCDIASALPLLYRAKRAVVIGDPKQLSHISQLGKGRDQRLLSKHDLLNDFPHWAYSYNSLFDLAASMAHGQALVNLRDHHRSHNDIISFSNKFFYEGKLRVATDYSRLQSPDTIKNAARWIDVKGQTIRPAAGGAQNEKEAHEIVNQLANLVLRQGYKGTIGVVSPFRAQVNLIQRLVNESPDLSSALIGSNFLVNTVHKFQGDERDIMIFSPVISNNPPRGAIGFLRSNGNLFNVAITRARAMLLVVGDISAATVSGVSYLEAFAKHIQELNLKSSEDESNQNIVLGAEYPAVVDDSKVSEWEKILYRRMYADGIRAIPQYGIDKYELDFALFDGDRKLDIEVDGERYHRNWDGELCRRDQIRNHRMFELGWDVMRFWVYEIRDDIDGCIRRIKDWQEGR